VTGTSASPGRRGPEPCPASRGVGAVAGSTLEGPQNERLPRGPRPSRLGVIRRGGRTDEHRQPLGPVTEKSADQRTNRSQTAHASASSSTTAQVTARPVTATPPCWASATA
jgi:hypothetical protein